jgi:predicted dinucleotide-binding enzyme
MSKTHTETEKRLHERIDHHHERITAVEDKQAAQTTDIAVLASQFASMLWLGRAVATMMMVSLIKQLFFS